MAPTIEGMGRQIPLRDAAKDFSNQVNEDLISEKESQAEKLQSRLESGVILKEAFKDMPNYEELKNDIRVFLEMKSDGEVPDFWPSHFASEYILEKESEILSLTVKEHEIDADLLWEIEEGNYQAGGADAHAFFDYVGARNLTYGPSDLEFNSRTGKLIAHEKRERTSRARHEQYQILKEFMKEFKLGQE